MEVPGVSNSDFLRLAANARRKQLGQEELGPLEFYGYVMPKVRSPVKPRECHWVAVIVSSAVLQTGAARDQRAGLSHSICRRAA